MTLEAKWERRKEALDHHCWFRDSGRRPGAKGCGQHTGARKVKETCSPSSLWKERHPSRHLANLGPHRTWDLQKQILNVSDMLKYMHEGETVNGPNWYLSSTTWLHASNRILLCINFRDNNMNIQKWDCYITKKFIITKHL